MTDNLRKPEIGSSEPQSWNNFWRKQPDAAAAEGLSWSKKRILQVLDPFVRRGKRVLDAGSGSGFFSKYFCDQGMHTVSVDFSDRALEMTSRITGNRTRILKHDLRSEDLEEALFEKFDLIFSDGLFEHFSPVDQDKILKNFCRLLDRDGMIITFVPNRWSPWQLIRPLFMPGISETPFVLKALIALKTQNNLRILESGGINCLPFSFSPDRLIGRFFGMLLYVVAKKDA
ncbi:MAG TPA: class I SAM-dependent methyltransferase [Candidatus Omnitrophota bacterium]|nr:class I SAM-dependent methyltransferase [Candidatus Omnitrophota bacterium]HPD85123.1 class I SAM-dependent methyltransferase [Candidatus Omnitrophota bacterium]HRZ03981.1 class I SAM-dependent methyltransferase [Candidatus Omnitrophota bacterium]